MTLGQALAVININPVMLGITALAAVIVGAVALYKHFNGTINKHIEKLQELNQEYESNESELQSLQSELETTAQRISELEGSESLSFVEQGELEKLKETNEELTREIALLKQRNEELSSARDQEAQDAWTTMNTALTQTVVVDFDTDSPTTLLYTDVEYADYLMEQIEELDKQINDLWADGMLDKSEEKTEKQLSKLRDDYKTTLEGIRDDAAAIGLDESNAFVDKILTFFDPSYGYELALNSVTSEMEEASEQLLELKQQMSEFEQGNVKLSIRPEVEIDGGYATVLSSWVDAVLPDDKTYAIHYTPILDDGTVLSESEIQAELDRLFEGAVNGSDILEMDKVENGGKGIILRVSAQLDTQTDEQFFSAENEWGQQLHLMQEEYYDLIRTIRENPEFINLIELLKELGLISDDTAKSLLYIAESIATIGETIDNLIPEKSFTDVYDKIEDGLKAISDAQKDVAETGYLSADSIKAIEKAGLSEYLVETEGGYKLAKGALDDYVASQRVEYEFALNEATAAAEQIINNSALEAAGYDTTTMSIYDQIKAMKELAAAKMIATANAFLERRVATGDTYSEANRMLSSNAEYQAAYNYWKQIDGVIDNINTAQSNLDTFNRAVSSFQRDSASSSKSSSQVEEYIAEIDKFREATERLERAQAEAASLEKTVSNFSDINAQKTQREINAINEKTKALRDSIVAYDELEEYYQIIDEAQSKGIDVNRTIYGNIDTNNRQILKWTEENLESYRDALESWGSSVDEMRDSYSTIFGSSTEFDGVEIAFSPMLQTANGAVLLDQNTVHEYIWGLIDKAGENWSSEDLLRLDTEGLEFDGLVIKNLLADIGDTAIATGEAMHFTGNTGAIADAFNEVKAAADAAGISVDDAMEAYLQATAEIGQSQQALTQAMYDGIVEQINIRKQLISTYQDEQDALHDLNEQRDAYIQSQVDVLRQRGFNVEYDPTNNKFFVENLEHLNDLVASSKGSYDTLQEATNAYRKENEDLIEDLESLNDANAENSETWWDLQYSIRSAKVDIVNNLQEIVSQASEAVDTIQSVYDTLKEAADEYASNGGFITVDTFQKIVELGPQYMQYLEDENGLLVINEERINAVIKAKTEQLALENAMTYVERLRLALEADSIEDLNNLLYATTENTNATWGLVYANLALLNLSDAQYQAALHNINALRSLAVNAVTSIGQVTNAYTSELNDMKSGLDDILQYVMDMLEDNVKRQIDALEDLKDEYNEIIAQRKEMLQLAERERQYEEDVADKTSEIAKLQTRIDALSLDDSRAAALERASLEEELAELKKDLADTQREHSIDCVEDALDQELDSFEKQQDEQIKILEDSISSTQKIYDMAIDYIESNWDTLYSELIQWNYNYGSNLESEISSAWDNCLAAAQRYGSFVNALNNIDSDIASASGSSNNTIVGTATQVNTAEIVESLIAQMKVNSGAWAGASNTERTKLEENNILLAQRIAALIGEAVVRGNDGWWYIGRVGGPKLYDDYKKYCYHTGGVVGNAPTLKQNEVLSLLNKGEVVLTATQQSNLMAMLDQLKPLNALKEALTSFRTGALQTASASAAPYIDASIKIDGYTPDDQMMGVLQRHERKVANMVMKYLTAT